MMAAALRALPQYARPPRMDAHALTFAAAGLIDAAHARSAERDLAWAAALPSTSLSSSSIVVATRAAMISPGAVGQAAQGAALRRRQTVHLDERLCKCCGNLRAA